MNDKVYYMHYIVSGRRCGGAEDSTGYICVPEEEDPESVFISEILYGELCWKAGKTASRPTRKIASGIGRTSTDA